MESFALRKKNLEQWLVNDCDISAIDIHPIKGDASFRQYFRVFNKEKSLIVMDASAQPESCAPFIAIANALRNMGLTTPEILAANKEQGFLLLTDFGDSTYLSALNETNADPLYRKAISALSVLQGCKQVEERVIPPFTREFMWQEWAWHKEWFLGKLLDLHPNQQSLEDCMNILIESAANQPQVFMHRDYHSGNLMILPNGEIGVLDFQDAFIGPVTYDLASLIRDCYINWTDENIMRWALLYWQSLTDLQVLKVSQLEFLRWFDLMSMQRHLKALFTFARKHVRDQQHHYLKFVPRTLNYLLQLSQRYPELFALHLYLSEEVKPAFERVLPPCAA